MRLSSELLISMDSQGPRARKLIGQFASRMGFKHDGVSKIDDCVNELILHLMNDHTRSGILGFKDFADNGTRGIELTTLTGRNGDRRKEWKQSLYALKRRAAAEVAVLRFARDAERAARPAHHRALELSRRHEEDTVCGGDALRPG